VIAVEDDPGARLRNAIAGVLLSLSLAVAGIWLVRRKLSRRAQTAMLLMTLTLAAASVTLADLRRGGSTRPRRPVQLPASSFPPGTLLKLRDVLGAETLSGKISVEFVSDGKPITLIVPAQR
jgi:hypothetical protein